MELSITGTLGILTVGNIGAGAEPPAHKRAAATAPITAKRQGITIATIPPVDKPFFFFIS